MNIVAVTWWLLSAILAGVTLLFALKLKWSQIEVLAVGAVLGISGLTLITFYLSWLWGFNVPIILGLATGSILVSLGWWIKNGNLNKRLKPFSFKRGKGWLTTLVFWGALFGFIWPKMLVREADGLYAGWVNIWGDWAAHLSYTTSFALGNNFPPQMPLLFGSRFSYPFLSDFLSAIFLKLGVTLVPAMIIPSFILSMLLVVWLVILGQAIGGKLKVGIITVLIFLFNGGLGWWWFVKDLKMFGVEQLLLNLPQEYTRIQAVGIEWINLISSQVVPQRGFLMGFPISLIVYWLFWRRMNKKDHKELIVAGILTAMLPLIHAHSLAAIMVVALTLMIVTKDKFKNWAWFWLIVAFVAGPQVIYFFGQSVGQSTFIHFQSGWLSSKLNDNWFWFWFKNLGTVLFLLAFGLKLASKKLHLFSIPFWALFAAANLWIFQPWEWDNTKLITHWYLMVSILSAIAVTYGLEQKNKLLKTVTIMVLGLSLTAGWLDAVRLTQYQQRRLTMVNNQDLQLADWVIANSSPKSIWLTADSHDHWLPVLTGRKIILGFKGWLWTYGLDYSIQEADVNIIWQGGEPATNLLKKYGINYIVIGPHEKRLVDNLNQDWFEENLRVAYQNELTKIYQLD